MRQNMINLVLIFAVAELMAHIGYGFFRWEYWLMILIAVTLICNNKNTWLFKKRRCKK